MTDDSIMPPTPHSLYSTLLYCILLHRTVLYGFELIFTLLYSTVLQCTKTPCTVPLYPSLYHTLQYIIVQYSTLHYITLQYSKVHDSTVVFSTLLFIYFGQGHCEEPQTLHILFTALHYVLDQLCLCIVSGNNCAVLNT